MSVLYVDTINEKTVGNGIIIPGHVLQVQQTVFGDVFSTSIGPSFAEVTGLRCNITPKSTSSKILVRLCIVLGTHYFQMRGRILRDGSVVSGAIGDTRGLRTSVSFNSVVYSGGAANSQYDMMEHSVEYLDSPATTSSVQYSVDIGGYSTTYPVYVNKSHVDSNGADYYGQPISTMTLMEIGG